MKETSDQPIPYQPGFYKGNKKGIQGSQNSCYLDSSFVALFALSDVFDNTIRAVVNNSTIDVNRRAIGEMIWNGIVNPLRKFVLACTLMTFSLKSKILLINWLLI